MNRNEGEYEMWLEEMAEKLKGQKIIDENRID